MDALSQLLQTLRLDIVASRHIVFHGPYGARFAPGEGPRGLFMVLDGDVWIEPEGDTEGPLHLSPGDIGLAGGPGFIVRDSSTPRSRPIDVRFETRSEELECLGGPDARTTEFLGVSFELEAGAAAPLLAALAPSVPRQTRDSLIATLMPSFQRVCEDFTSGRPGAQALINQVTQLLLLEWVRAAIPRDGTLGVGAFADPPIAAALALMHRQPGAPWTVDSLAERVSLARTSFALRFARHVGESPFRYLTRRRISLATRLLQASTLPLHEVALRVGYADEASFHRAFKRETGMRPGAVRASRPAFHETS
ncbi:cupin domain-containing protein [Melittangium boletus]|uniref:AraC family transcriptional regulator n=1 Tax=Melittangium boletus DSM 14713 TaxID=1294270 RepID=A0A250ICQ9_9BACT|nr:AraC family transcriptional regulator [Melittangium boletus]ATB28736.1 AraC family transcriptional regulator [Melittangium boletus DSM 14713]